jgi:GNAT superfamily N-acetyltransferase
VSALHIIQAEPEHLVVLAQKLGSDPLFARYELSPEALATSFNKALARREGMLIAMGSQGPEGLAWFTRDGAFGRGAYLRLLAVAQSAQAKGLGRRLLAAFEAACLPAPSGWFLLCSDFNSQAQRFYTAQGYQKVGALPGFVRSDVAEIIFYKPALTPQAQR